ncbi:MAG: histidine triad nucleotide-binding protein [Desulfobacterales bacterium]|nr:histidine triad nucleotide-binding protein [Desulfobacterales bacterium]
MEKDCLFCKIVNKEIPTDFLYEDDMLVVFRDINPQSPVHLLIVPKKHIRSINDLTEEDKIIVGEMAMLGKEMAKREGIDQSGYKLLFNVENGGGQMIFHLHQHLVGGWEGDAKW